MNLSRTLKHVAQYSPLIAEHTKRVIAQHPPQGPSVKQRFPPDQLPLSELPMFLSKQFTLDVQVYTVWGACEDVRVLEKFRSGEYKVDNLHIIDEASSRLLDIGGVKLRLLGLGGAVVMHKLFDNGEGKTTIAGGQGTMWTTLLQMGELVDTANRVYDPTETRVFVTHASPAREGLLNQLSVTLKADFSISAGLHFRYGSSYNEFSVNPTLDHYRGKLAASKASFNDVWETVKGEVEPAVAQNDAQQTLLSNALEIVQKMPAVANGSNPFGGHTTAPGAGGQVDESAFKNMWNFNLADAAFGYLVLEVEGGRIGTEMRAQGFNFAHRSGKHGMVQPTPGSATGSTPNASNQAVGHAAALAAPAQHRSSAAPSAQSSQHVNQNQHPSQAQQPRNQPPPPPYTPQQQLPQQQAKPHNGPPRAGSSPAPAVPSQVKPATPQPTGTTVDIPSAAPTDKTNQPMHAKETRNGTSSNEKAAAPPQNKPSSPVQSKPSTGLFIMNMESEEAIREIFPEEDRAKIHRIQKLHANFGRSNFVVHFSNHEDTKAAYERQPPEHKKPTPQGQPRKPSVKYYEERPPRQPSQGAGAWQASNRGGANVPQRGGYQSGASDSEGGRGRGGFGGRGGRGRGGERGRGGRGGRGNFNNNKASTGGDGSPPGPAPATPAVSTSAPAPSGGES